MSDTMLALASSGAIRLDKKWRKRAVAYIVVAHDSNFKDSNPVCAAMTAEACDYTVFPEFA